MDDATQKLVNRADEWLADHRQGESWRLILNLKTTLADALEAAQRPPVAGDEADAPAWVDRHGDVWIFRNGMGWSFETQPFTREHIEKKWGPLVPLAAQRPPVSGEYTHVVNLARASEAADKGLDALIDYLADLPTVEEWRPPVSPEVREALVDTLTSPVRAPGSVAASRVFRAETPEDLEDATALADAILARFSIPVLDGEKVAQWLRSHDDYGVYRDGYLDAENIAAALVADLHTLTTDGTPSDTERNES